MAKVVGTYTYYVAECYASALVNGDSTGLEEDEDLLVQDFEAYLQNLHGGPNKDLVLEFSEEAEYETCEVSDLYANCLKMTVTVLESENEEPV